MSRSLSISNADLSSQNAKNKSSGGVRSALVSSSYFDNTREGSNEVSGSNADAELGTSIDIVGAINNLKLDEEDEQEAEELEKKNTSSSQNEDKNQKDSIVDASHNYAPEATNFGFPMYPPHPQSPYYFAPYQGSDTSQQQLKTDNGIAPPANYASGWNGHPGGGLDSQFGAISHQGYVPVSEPPLGQNRDGTNVPFIKPLEFSESKDDAQSKQLNGLSLSQDGESSTIVTSDEQDSNKDTLKNKNDDDSRKQLDHKTPTGGGMTPQHVNLPPTPPFNPFSPMSMNHPIGPGVPPGVPSPMMPYNYPPPFPPHHQQPNSRNFQTFDAKANVQGPLPPALAPHINAGPSPPNLAQYSGTVWNSQPSESITRGGVQQLVPPHIGNPPYPLNHHQHQQQAPLMPHHPLHQQHQHQHQHQQYQQHMHHPLQFQGGGNGGAPFMQHNHYNRGHSNNRRNNKHVHHYQNYGHNYGMTHFSGGNNGGAPYRQRKGEDANKYQNAKIQDYRGHILDLCSDQHGCRFLQRELAKEQDCLLKRDDNKSDGSKGDGEIKDESVSTMIFNELHDEVVNLMLDPFGNYLIQKLVECVSNEQRLELIKYSSSQFNRIALDSHGTRALQKLIECVGALHDNQEEVVDENDSASLIIKSLEPSIVLLSRDLNGNHVVQKCLINLSNKVNQVIYDTITSNCEVVACHRHGCCVIQRCLDYGNDRQVETLSHEVTTKLGVFTTDPYGNYVVQYVLSHGDSQSIDTIFAYLRDHFYQLSIHKFGSNVLEKSLRLEQKGKKENEEENNSSTRSASLIDELLKLSLDQFSTVLNDSFGNYVLQTCLDVAQLVQMTKLREMLVPLLPEIKLTPHGRRIANKLQ